jgi:hypothetical protein
MEYSAVALNFISSALEIITDFSLPTTIDEIANGSFDTDENILLLMIPFFLISIGPLVVALLASTDTADDITEFYNKNILSFLPNCMSGIASLLAISALLKVRGAVINSKLQPCNYTFDDDLMDEEYDESGYMASVAFAAAILPILIFFLFYKALRLKDETDDITEKILSILGLLSDAVSSLVYIIIAISLAGDILYCTTCTAYEDFNDECNSSNDFKFVACCADAQQVASWPPIMLSVVSKLPTAYLVIKKAYVRSQKDIELEMR